MSWLHSAKLEEKKKKDEEKKQKEEQKQKEEEEKVSVRLSFSLLFLQNAQAVIYISVKKTIKAIYI